MSTVHRGCWRTALLSVCCFGGLAVPFDAAPLPSQPGGLPATVTFPAPSAAAPADTVLGIADTRFTVNGKPTFLLGLSYYGALGAPEATLRADLAEMQQRGFNWIRVWATWDAFSNDVSAVASDGSLRKPFVDKLKWLIAQGSARRLVVDVTLSRGNGATGPARLQTLAAHRRAVESLVQLLKPYRNWYLDLSNERNVRDSRFTSFEDLGSLRALVRALDPSRLVTASHAGDMTREDLQRYVQSVGLDFLTPHRPRDPGSPTQTGNKTAEYLAWMKEMRTRLPVHYQEPFRRGYGPWEPSAEDFVTDARLARQSGAAGWCFHNGAQRTAGDGQPRRSFDLRARRLFEQLDAVERRALDELERLFRSP